MHQIRYLKDRPGLRVDPFRSIATHCAIAILLQVGAMSCAAFPQPTPNPSPPTPLPSDPDPQPTPYPPPPTPVPSDPEPQPDDDTYRNRSVDFHGELLRRVATGPVPLGAGYSVLSSTPRASALQADLGTLPKDEYEMRYSIDYAESSKDLARSLGLGLSASGSWGTGSASGKASLLRETKSHQYSGSLVVTAYALRRTEVAVTPRLNDEAERLLRDSPERFYATYGDTFVYRKGWGAELTAVLQVEARKYETREEFKASMKASQGTFRASASVSSSLSETLKDRKVNVRYAQNGGSFGRAVCLDKSKADSKPCAAWPGEAGTSPSRGGVVALSLEELIIRLRDFSKEVWDNQKDAAQLIYFDVLDYSAIPRDFDARLYDRVVSIREMEDLAGVLHTLEDRLADVQFAMTNRQLPVEEGNKPPAPDTSIATVLVSEPISEQLPRIEWLYEKGVELVSECLEDRARVVGEDCLQTARTYYTTNELGGLKEDLITWEEIDGCDLFPKKEADDVTVTSASCPGSGPLGLDAVRACADAWSERSFQPCADRHLTHWQFNERGEVLGVRAKATAISDLPDPLFSTPEAAQRFLETVTLEPEDVTRELAEISGYSGFDPPAESAPLDEVITKYAEQREKLLCEDAAAKMAVDGDTFIECLLAHRLSLGVPPRPIPACEEGNLFVARSDRVEVPRNRSGRRPQRAARLELRAPKDKKIKLCSQRLWVRANGSSIYKSYSPGHDGRWWKAGRVQPYDHGSGRHAYAVELENERTKYPVRFSLELSYGFE